MRAVHIQKLGEKPSPLTHGSSIQKEDDVHFLCCCHTRQSSLSEAIHRICVDEIVGIDVVPKANYLALFTGLLEAINHKLDELYLEHKKTDVSLFVGMLVDNHLHFSVFGKEITGIIASSTSINDITVDMDAGEGRFVYDSHGDIKDDETLYLFSPQVAEHIIGDECKNLGHLTLAERTELLANRLERSYREDAVIMTVGTENIEPALAPSWNPEKLTKNPTTVAFTNTITQASKASFKKIQSSFVQLSQETQNWVIISGIIVSVILLYIIIASIIQSQYTIFIPQKYRDMIAEARVGLDEASRMIDQPENFKPAITKVKNIIKEVETANVLKIDVAELTTDVTVLERAINKVNTLDEKEYTPVYTFSGAYDSLPFAIHSYDNKISLITTSKIIGPFAPGETAKEYSIPDDEKFSYSDIDADGKIYLVTTKDRVYTFEKGTYNLQNIQQVGGWDRSLDISVYNSNIYLLGTDRRQVYKYKKQGENIYLGRSFLLADNQAKQIISLDVDGSVWLLSGADSVVRLEKILTAPKYERRPITINGLGINTIQNFNPETTKIYSSQDYQEIYLLADNRIWIFMPGSKRFSDVRFVTYIGQLDIPDIIITDLAVEQDGDVRRIYFGSPKSGVFMTKLSIAENKINVLPNQ